MRKYILILLYVLGVCAQGYATAEHTAEAGDEIIYDWRKADSNERSEIVKVLFEPGKNYAVVRVKVEKLDDVYGIIRKVTKDVPKKDAFFEVRGRMYQYKGISEANGKECRIVSPGGSWQSRTIVFYSVLPLR